MMSNIIINQSDFLPHQWEFLTSWAKTLGLIGGLGSGKTVPFLFKTLYCHVMRPGANGKSNIGTGYPSLSKGKALCFYPLCDLLSDARISFRHNLSDQTITSAYGTINMFSMHNPERIVGDTYTDAGMDELDTLPKAKGLHVVRKVRERLRGRKDAQLYIVSSPESYSACYDVLKDNPNPNTKLIHADTRSNKYLPQEYIDDIMATYDERMALAYIRGQFVNLNNMQAHYAFRRDVHVAHVEPPPPELPLQIGVDFNVDPMTACVGYWDGDVLKIFDEYYLRHSNTYQLADLIADDYPGRVIETYPDPTGVARKSSADASDIQILQRKGFSAKWINGVTQRESLNLANGEISHNRVVIDPKCENLIHDLEQVVTDSHGQILKPKDTLRTHISDAMRNIIVYKKKQPGRWSAY